jgi:hypothetical protein
MKMHFVGTTAVVKCTCFKCVLIVAHDGSYILLLFCFVCYKQIELLHTLERFSVEEINKRRADNQLKSSDYQRETLNSPQHKCIVCCASIKGTFIASF